MIRILTYIIVITQTALVTGGIGYWLHLRKIRRLLKWFHGTIQEVLGIINDDPNYTVVVRKMDLENVLPPFQQDQPRPYDWELDEKFEQIIDKNFPLE